MATISSIISMHSAYLPAFARIQHLELSCANFSRKTESIRYYNNYISTKAVTNALNSPPTNFYTNLCLLYLKKPFLNYDQRNSYEFYIMSCLGSLCLQQVNRLIIQMGNSLQDEHRDQRHALEPISVDPRYDYLSHYKNTNGDLFLARQIQLPENTGLQNFKNRLQNRQKYSFQTSCIYPLDHCYFEHMRSMCSQQQRCLLTCTKPRNNLQKIFEERRLAGIAFTPEEINLVLSNISKAFKTFSQLDEPFCSLRMNHIAINNNVYLIDPILIESDPFGYGSLGEYPAPEQLSQQEQILSKEYIMQQHLFSLGVIGLQLYHTSSNVKDIYERYHKYGSIVSINMPKLNQHISNILDPYLRAKIATLTSFNSETRKNIYRFIQKEAITIQIIQNIVKSLQISKPLHHFNPSLSPIINHNAIPIRETVLKELNSNQNGSISPLNKHPHLQKLPAIDENNNLIKPKVSINFISKIHNSNNQQPNLVNTNNSKKSITFHNASKRQPQNRPQTNNKQLIAQQTPLRIKKKHNFSTIKQVSEYDECTSTSRVHTFQDLSISGNYEGQMMAGKRHGRGTLYFQEGSIYQGQWKEDQMHGHGRLYYPSGKLAYEGQWRNNQFSGRGKVYNDEPKMLNEAFDFTDFNQLGEEWVYYEGNLLQDQKQGKGCLVLSNGQSFKGDFLCDKVHGAGSFLTLQGKTIQGVWNDSILQRTFVQ